MPREKHFTGGSTGPGLPPPASSRSSARRAVLIITTFLASLFLACQAKEVVITLDPGTTYQTIVGWEAGTQIGQTSPTHGPDVPWRDEVIDLAANDLGINRVRLGIMSGEENPVDYYQRWVDGIGPHSDWVGHFYDIQNDNDDPFTINWSGFQYGMLDHAIEEVVLPLRQALEARGEKLYVDLNYVDFGNSSFEHYDNPEEYAEFMLAAFIHMRDKYGFVPDAIEVILEPDNTDGWAKDQIGPPIVATANRLGANGFDVPDFIAPSTLDLGDSIEYFDEIIKTPGVLGLISELSYHRYAGRTDGNLRTIASRIARHNIRSSMLEKIKADHEALHKDLKLANVSAWEQFSLAFPGTDDGAHYYYTDSNDNLLMGRRTKFLRQYFKFIRSGARRIEATSNRGNFDPVAFINTNGTYVVVVKASSEGSFSIEGLPAGTYGIKYTTSESYDVDLEDVSVADASLTTGIPYEGVITIYGK